MKYDMAMTDIGGSVSFDVLVAANSKKAGELKAKAGVPVLGVAMDGKLAEGHENSSRIKFTIVIRDQSGKKELA